MAEADPEKTTFEPVYLCTLAGERYGQLAAWWQFYDGTQHDHCKADWAGRSRPARQPYLSGRVPEKGFAGRTSARASHDDRRPNVQLGLTQRVVDRYTETTCGRPAALSVPGDEDSTCALEASFEASNTWDAIVEIETIGGAVGSAAVVTSVIDGEFCDEVLFPFEVYVRSWADRRRWIPSEVIHQVHVDVERRDPDTGKIVCKRLIKTRLWTEVHTITFEPVDPDEWDATKPLKIADDEDAVIEHHAGRCPVVWHQNTRSHRTPEGQPDMRTASNLELSDMADRVASHAVKATRNNAEPTIHRADRDIMFMQIPAIAKGAGNEIRTSEVGKVSYLETDGRSVEMAWSGVDRLTLTVLRNTNCVIMDVDLDMASRGNGDSGEALQQRAGSMHKRCNRKRVTLGTTIKQMAKIRLAMMRHLDISSEDDPKDGTIILPPRCFKDSDQHTGEEHDEMSQAAGQDLLAIKQSPAGVLGWSGLEPFKERYEAHRLGQGTAVAVRWPPYNELTPLQIQAFTTAVGQATGSKQSLSQQTAIELVASALGLPDALAEKRRVMEEKQAGLHMVQPMVEHDDGELAETVGADTAAAGDEREPTPGKAGAAAPADGTTAAP